MSCKPSKDDSLLWQRNDGEVCVGKARNENDNSDDKVKAIKGKGGECENA
jgi:hypothetical protein